MRKTNANKRKLSPFVIAFLAVALVFLAVGYGTLGSFRTAGEDYELTAPVTDSEGVEQTSDVIMRLTPRITETYTDENGAESTRTVNLLMKDIYFYVSAIYSEPGTAGGLSVSRGTSERSTSFVRQQIATFENIYTPETEVAEGETPPKGPDATDVLYNWVKPFVFTETWRLTSYNYVRLSATSANMRIAEVVFVGKPDGEASREEYIVAAEVVSATPQSGETAEQARTRASALVDSDYNEGAKAYNAAISDTTVKVKPALPEIPASAVSSYDRFTQEELYSLLTITEMRVGDTYTIDERTGTDSSVYRIDSVYNVLGTDLLALGTMMFGMSPFGLRFFPMLFSFGILVVGFLFVRRLTRSDRAGFLFAFLYALCDLSFSLGHVGTPLTAGIFFVLLSAYLCHGFYAKGMKKAGLLGAMPLVFSGLAGAAAICVNGAMVIPVAAVCGLYVAGMIRQQKAKRYYLDRAIEGETDGDSGEEVLRKKERAAKVITEYRAKNLVAGTSFPAALLLGSILLSLLLILPLKTPLVKMYGDPQAAVSIFLLGWKAFAGGFTGVNALGTSKSAWSIFYKIFVGTGETYAVTAAVINGVALAAAVFGVVYAAVSIALCLKTRDRAAFVQLRRVLVPLAGLVVSLVCASFGGGALGFILLAYVFGFVLAAYGADMLMNLPGKGGAVAKGVTIAALILLLLCFMLFAVFTFSVPLPAATMSKFVG